MHRLLPFLLRLPSPLFLLLFSLVSLPNKTNPLSLDTHYHLSPRPLPPSATHAEYADFASTLDLKNTVSTQPALLSSNHEYLLSHASSSQKIVGLFTPPPSTLVYDSGNDVSTSIHDLETYSELQSVSPYLTGMRLNPTIFSSEVRYSEERMTTMSSLTSPRICLARDSSYVSFNVSSDLPRSRLLVCGA